MIIRIHFHHASLHELTICSSWEHSWWFVVFDGLYTYIHVCSIWNMHSMIMLEINWQLHCMRKCKTHVSYAINSLRLQSRVPVSQRMHKLLFSCPFTVSNRSKFLRHKESIFVKWGVQLTDNEMSELYLFYSLLALVHTYMSSQPFYLLHMPSVWYE